MFVCATGPEESLTTPDNRGDRSRGTAVHVTEMLEEPGTLPPRFQFPDLLVGQVGGQGIHQPDSRTDRCDHALVGARGRTAQSTPS